MGAGRKARERREPVFDATPAAGLDLRLSAEDRPGGAPESAAESPKASKRKAANDDGQRAERARKSPKPARKKSSDSKGSGKGGGKGGGRSLIGRMAYWAAVMMLWVGIAAGGLLLWVGAHLPPIQSLEVPKRPPSIQIVAADGQAMANRGEMGGASVPLSELPKYLPAAFIAIEDRRFYDHLGVDVIGVARAIVTNLLHRGVSQGGSTLTQQLAKNLFLTQERTMERKLQELLLAFWLERKFSKAQILELYINRVYFGAGAYGVEAAAQRYFAKSARQLTLSESAMLAGLVKSPSRLAPTRNPEGAAARAKLVLAAMADSGLVAPEMVKVASAHPAAVARKAGASSANYVADWVMDVLDDVVGRVDQDLVVETTIDMRLQAAAEQALVDELNQKGAKFDVEQGAVIAMSPNGAIRALVGGRNYAESQFNRAIAAKRQPGSAFKPFVYLTALERGLTPETLREDRPINIKGWQPENYTREYFGAVTLTRALAMSLNTVAVRLALEVTPKAVVQTAHRMGIASKLEPNASIALGTSEVSVLEMATAFAPFANGGIANTPYVVTRVRTPAGKTIYQGRPESMGRIVDARYVGMMNTMMQETLLSGTARKAELPGWQAAGKTGTSQDFRDAWFVGYTANLVTTVWLGNDDSSPTKKTTGGGLPVDIWSRFMKVAHQGVTPVGLPGVGIRYQAPAPSPGLFGAPVAQAPSSPQAYPQQAYPQGQDYPQQGYPQQGYAPARAPVMAGRPVPPADVGRPVPPGDIGRRAPPRQASAGNEGFALDRFIGSIFGR